MASRQDPLTPTLRRDRNTDVSPKLIPKKTWVIPVVTQALSSLARLTLRQLRQMASDLGVTLYSRKSKQDLVSAIAERQERKSGDQKAIESELSPPTLTEALTRVVFLPRHGRAHAVAPHEINYRANVHAMKQLGVEWLISLSAVGSMREEIRPQGSWQTGSCLRSPASARHLGHC